MDNKGKGQSGQDRMSMGYNEIRGSWDRVYFRSKGKVMKTAKELNAIPFDVECAGLSRYEENGEEPVSFDSIIRK
jgi:hypothetical protein